MTLIQDDDLIDADASIDSLRKEERRWFSWLSVLHERGSKTDSPNAAIVLDIAKKRWMRAREALRREGAGAHSAAD